MYLHLISVRCIDQGQTTICQKKNPKGHCITRIHDVRYIIYIIVVTCMWMDIADD